MTDAANSKVEDHSYWRAYSGLEPAICELAHIAAITRFYVSEGSGADDRIVTVVSHVANMAEALREAFYAGSNSNPASSAK
jgi:hypothetical protein